MVKITKSGYSYFVPGHPGQINTKRLRPLLVEIEDFEIYEEEVKVTMEVMVSMVLGKYLSNKTNGSSAIKAYIGDILDKKTLLDVLACGDLEEYVVRKNRGAL